MSHRKEAAVPPDASTNASPASSLVSATATLAPLATSNSTVARPMPLPPPVTIIVLPLNSDISPSNSSLSASRFHYRSEEHTSDLLSLMRTSYDALSLNNNNPSSRCYKTTPSLHHTNHTSQ